jgi:rare lipoprotein A
MKVNITNSGKFFPVFFCLFIVAANGYSQEIAKTTDVVLKKKKEVGRTLYGQASFYSNKFEGRRTANGEIYSQKKMTAACNSLPLGTWIEVTNLRNNRSVIVKTNDRLHPKMKRVVDLTLAAARKLDFVSSGLTRVKVVVLKKQQHK